MSVVTTMPVEPSAAPTETIVIQAAAVADHETHGWQTRLLPFLLALIGTLTAFFLVATLVQLRDLQYRIGQSPSIELAEVFNSADAGQPLTAGDRMLFVQWRTLVELEKNALERRYHQANVLLMARTWTRYLGFLTGMILAFLGAGFILGKFRELDTSIRVNSSPVKAALSTTSPGIVLAVLGSALMMATILMHTEIETRDAPMYVNFQLAPAEDTRPSALPSEADASPEDILRSLGNDPIR